jgi:hypothetical protein
MVSLPIGRATNQEATEAPAVRSQKRKRLTRDRQPPRYVLVACSAMVAVHRVTVSSPGLSLLAPRELEADLHHVGDRFRILTRGAGG